MTVDSARLLQMLEPTVRPGNASANSGVQQGKPAFENRTFDDLLNEVQTGKTDGTQAAQAKPAQTSHLLALGGLGQVENAVLRNVLAQAYGSGLGQTD